MERDRQTPAHEPDAAFETLLNTMSLAQAASFYARLGWPVFPLQGKVPFKDSNGYKDATGDEATIQAWWKARPHANIGLPTGAISGVLVVDIDPRHNGHQNVKALEKQYALLPATLTCKTAHGGLHRYYQYPQDENTYPNTVGFAGYTGIDIRGNGGYVLLPPSRLYNRLTYKWGNTHLSIAHTPDWLLQLLAQEKQEVAPQGMRFATSSSAEKWFSEAVARAREGNRNQIGFFLACQLRDDGVSEAEAREIVLAYAQQVGQGKEPYTIKEALASVKSAYKRPPRERARGQR